MFVWGEGVAPDAVAAAAPGGVAAGGGAGGVEIGVVGAVLDLEEVAGKGTGEVVGFEGGGVADVEAVFGVFEDAGGMFAAAVDAAGAGAIAGVFGFAFTLAIAGAVFEEFVGPVGFAVALAVTIAEAFGEFFHAFFELFELFGVELAEVFGVEFGELVEELWVGFHGSVLEALEGLLEVIGEFFLLIWAELVAAFGEGVEGFFCFVEVFGKALDFGLVGFFEGVGGFEGGVAEPVLFFLGAELVEAVADFLEIGFIDEGVLGELFELGIEL